MTTNDQEQDEETKDSQENQDDSSDQAKDNSSSQSGEADKVTLEKVSDLATGLQKGYTMTRQDIADIKNNIESITEALNQKSGAKEGDDDYATKSDIKRMVSEALNETARQQATRQQKFDQEIDRTVADLKAEGIIGSKADEEALIQHAVDIQQPDLRKAALSYQKIKEATTKAGKEAIVEAAKKKAKQEEGSGVGGSSRSTGSEQGGISYAKLKEMQANDEF